jgi:hypothetical protein
VGGISGYHDFGYTKTATLQWRSYQVDKGKAIRKAALDAKCKHGTTQPSTIFVAEVQPGLPTETRKVEQAAPTESGQSGTDSHKKEELRWTAE